jgi:hypothetical protein
MLTNQEINEAFINAHLEENYNFLQDDLVKLADAFIALAKPRIADKEFQFCEDVVRSLNSVVADKLVEIRNNLDELRS